MGVTSEHLVYFVCGFMGGLFVEILGIYKLRKLPPKERPPWLNSPFYWFWTFLMMCSGGILVLFYGLAPENTISPPLGLNIGASAPLIIGAFADRLPDVSIGKID